MFQKVYRVRVDGTEEIFITEKNFKWLYQHTLWSMRGALHGHRFYELRYSIIQQGILLEKNDYNTFVPIRDVCSISVSVIDGSIRTHITKYYN